MFLLAELTHSEACSPCQQYDEEKQLADISVRFLRIENFSKFYNNRKLIMLNLPLIT